LATRADLEPLENLAQVPLNGASAQEQLRANLWVGAAVAGEASYLHLLRCELILRLDSAPAHLFACRQELSACTLAKRLHPDRTEHVVGCAQLIPSVDTPPLGAQPLAVEKMCTRKLRTDVGTAQPIDRFAF